MEILKFSEIEQFALDIDELSKVYGGAQVEQDLSNGCDSKVCTSAFETISVPACSTGSVCTSGAA